MSSSRRRGTGFLVISAPNTGTRFMRTITGADAIHGFDRPRIESVLDRYTHFICPLRDPYSVWVSQYSKQGTGHSTRGLEDFHHLQYWDERIGLFFCPVDLGDRSRELSEHLGIPIKWGERVGHTPSKVPPERDLTEFYEMPFIKRFYARR